MIAFIIPLILFTHIEWISATQQTGYADALCGGLPITSLRLGMNIADIITHGPTLTEQTYRVTNAPNGFEEIIPRFISSAVHPTGQIYVLFNFEKIKNMQPYFLGTLDRITSSITIVNPATPLQITQFTSITFDCNGILYAINTNTRHMYTIDTQTSAAQLFESGANKVKCGIFTDCVELLSYNFDTQLFHRISSGAGQKYELFVRQPSGIGSNIETVHTIDTNGYCNDVITALEYIGNFYFLIACGGTKHGIYLLDVHNIAKPIVIDIAAGAVPIGAGIIASDFTGSVCIPPYCNTPVTAPQPQPQTTATTTTTATTATTTAESVIIINNPQPQPQPDTTTTTTTTTAESVIVINNPQPQPQPQPDRQTATTRKETVIIVNNYNPSSDDDNQNSVEQEQSDGSDESYHQTSDDDFHDTSEHDEEHDEDHSEDVEDDDDDDDDLDDMDDDSQQNEPGESFETKGGEMKQNVLFGGKDIEASDNSENKTGDKEFSTKWALFLIISMVIFVVFLIGSIAVFCCYRIKNQQSDQIQIDQQL